MLKRKDDAMDVKLERLKALVEKVEGRRVMDADKVLAWVNSLLLVADDVDGEAFDLGTMTVNTKTDATRLLSAVSAAVATSAVALARSNVSCGHSSCMLQRIISQATRQLVAIDPDAAARLIAGVVEAIGELSGDGFGGTEDGGSVPPGTTKH